MKILINFNGKKETQKEAVKREKKLREYARMFRISRSQVIRDLIDGL